MAKRTITEATKQLFEQYGQTKGQPLPKPDALKMLTTEFRLTEDEALHIFEFFDADHNDKLSMWEYEKFLDKIGHKARAFMDLFKELEDKSKPGFLNISIAFDRFKAMQKSDGSKVDEEQLTKNLQIYMGEEKSMDMRKFINFMCGPLELCRALPDN